MTFCFEDLDPDSKEFLKKHVPSAVNCKSLDELLLELDDFITSTLTRMTSRQLFLVRAKQCTTESTVARRNS